MPRIKINLPGKFFDISIQIPVRVTDINYGNHLGNDSIVGIIHESRMQFLQQSGFTELDIEGTGLIMADIFVEFKNESFYKDIIEIRIAKGDISKISFELFYSLTTKRNNQQIIIAIAKTTMVCYNYTLRKPVTLPGKLLDLLS